MGRALIVIGVKGNDATAALQFAAAGVSDFTPYFRALHPAWLESREEMYRTAGASIGHPWASPFQTAERDVYIWAKGAMTGSRPGMAQVLRWFGPRAQRERLQPSLVDPRHREHIADFTPAKGSFGTAVPHAERNHTGSGPPGPDFLPIDQRFKPIARRLIDAGATFERAITETASIWLGRIADGASASGDGTRVRHTITTADVLASRLAGDVGAGGT